MSPIAPDLLLSLLHSDPDLPGADQLGALTPGQWQDLTAAAIRYKLAFQLLSYLDSAPQRRSLAPQACLHNLANTVRNTLMRNLAQQAHLRRMLSACQAENIPVMLLKGLWLGEAIYRDLKARPTGDIDLLLRPEDMPRYTRLVRTLGFDVPANAGNFCDIASTHNTFSLFHPLQKSQFDVHWSLTQPATERPIDETKLWARSEYANIAGMQCRTLGLEDHLLYLCFHAAIHHQFMYVGPRALLDVARLIVNPPRPIDWADLVDRAREREWTRGVWLMLDLVRKHLGVPAPQVVLQALRPRDANHATIHDVAMSALFIDLQFQGKLPPNLAVLMNDTSLRGRASILLKRIFISREALAAYFQIPVNMPGLQWFYLKRWGLMIRQYLPNIISLVIGNHARRTEMARMQTISRWING